jgi:DNA polymerase-4
VLHVDLDEFLAAVEIARRPALRGKPVVVGGQGDPTQRAVVATASYAAREFGIRSGMPLRTAARRCPEAVFLPSDRPAYEAASEKVMATLRRFPVVVEVLGWDEAFLGVQTADPEALAADVQRAVKQTAELACSVGIGDNRLRAKLATGFAKPAGIYRLTRHNWLAVMGDRSPEALWGIGPKTAKKLAAVGITSVVQLAGTDTAELARRFGPTMGPWYRALALGAGGADVSADRYLPRSRSRETTFQHDITDRRDLEHQLVVLAERVADDVGDEGRRATRVAVKVRFAPFFTQTRSVTLPAPTKDAAEITRAARGLLDRFEPGRPIRLLGVRAELEPPS